MRKIKFVICLALIVLSILSGCGGSSSKKAEKGNISGLVVNSAGKPIKGVSISLDNTSVIATTGDDGKYFIGNVEGGSHKVFAFSPDFYKNSVTVKIGTGNAQADTIKLKSVKNQEDENTYAVTGEIKF